MRIHLSAGAPPRLESPGDFKRFSIALDPALAGDQAAALAPVGELDAQKTGHAWVRPDAVRALSAMAGQPEWEASFASMVEYATRYGWVDSAGRIMAHLEWLETPPVVAPQAFRDAMRRFASGVCIVATGEGDNRCGMTVSAFTSVSADPPMVLVCLNRASGSHDCLTGAQSYSINILGGGQEETAMLFAGQRGVHGAARFDDAWRQSASGAPVLATAHHSIVCTSAAQHAAGSHTVLIGRVIESFEGQGNAALVNYEGVMGQTSRSTSHAA